MHKKSIFIVAHKFNTHPDDEFFYFLNKEKYPNVAHIHHSFMDAPDRKSYFFWYRDGEVFEKLSSIDAKGWPEPLIYVKELFYTIKWYFHTKMNWDFYVGMDGLCVLFGNLLRSIGAVKKTVYWAIDFVPKGRFEKATWKEKIYHFVNVKGYYSSDEMWDLSPRMAEARETFLGIKASDYKLHRVVPYGVWIDRVKKFDFVDSEKNTLVFMGHLLPKQGVQLVLKAIPQIVKSISEFKFKIIGGGQYGDELKSMAKELNVEKHCDFRGKIPDHRDLENELAKSSLAIAPYIKELDTWSYYADPGKVKTYLACGLPILLTDIPWNAKEITEKECGSIITEDLGDIAEKVIKFMDHDLNQIYRENARKYAQGFNYENTFSSLMLELNSQE